MQEARARVDAHRAEPGDYKLLNPGEMKPRKPVNPARNPRESATVEVFRSFDDQSARNAEIALRNEHIPYTLTHSTEGSSEQFKMVEFHVSEKDAARAHSIIDTEINADGGTPEAD
mgnify:CR=1 FL=1